MLVSDDNFAAAGRPLPGKEVHILDANGNECPIGEVGEVCPRGGWLRSDDTDTTDRNCYVTMRGCFAELITAAGRTWFSRELEDALRTQLGVKEAAVVALPAAALGQCPAAYVMLVGGAINLAALKRANAPLVPYDLTPLTIKSVRAFSMTSTGTIANAELCDSVIVDA
jgi:long-chain acyl-CoA synthetase